MSEKAVISEFGTKTEKLRNIQKKVKMGTKGKAKLSNMKQLLEKNSEQLKQKISEYFANQRKVLDKREVELLNKVNVFIDRRIAEIDDKLKHLQQKLDYLDAYHCCLEDKNSNDCPASDDFDCFMAASRYDFYVEGDGLWSFKKLGSLKQTDVLVTKLDSSDEDDSEDDDLCKDNIIMYEFLKANEASNKCTETESSDTASSCSVLSYKEVEEYEDEKNKIKKLDDMDDYELLGIETPKEKLCKSPITEHAKIPSTNLNLDSNKLVTDRTFERENVIEKMIEVFKNSKLNESEINKTGSQILKEERCETVENEETSLAEKVANSIKLCQSLNQQKEALSRSLPAFKKCPLSIASIQNLKTDDSLQPKGTKYSNHCCLISDFNSRVQMILNEGASEMEVDV